MKHHLCLLVGCDFGPWKWMGGCSSGFYTDDNGNTVYHGPQHDEKRKCNRCFSVEFRNNKEGKYGCEDCEFVSFRGKYD